MLFRTVLSLEILIIVAQLWEHCATVAAVASTAAAAPAASTSRRSRSSVWKVAAFSQGRSSSLGARRNIGSCFVRPGIFSDSSSSLRESRTRSFLHPPPYSKLVQAEKDVPSLLKENDGVDCDDPFIRSMIELGYSKSQQMSIIKELSSVGLWNDGDNGDDNGISNGSSTRSATFANAPSATLQAVTRDFLQANSNAAAVSTLLIQDFQLAPIVAHQTRAALQHWQSALSTSRPSNGANPAVDVHHGLQTSDNAILFDSKGRSTINSTIPFERRYKAAIVSPTAQKRQQVASANRLRTASSDTSTAVLSSFNALEYGLPREYERQFTTLATELQQYWNFMTIPNTDMQGEPCLRQATAKIYLSHAKLFLGWYWYQHYLPSCTTPSSLSKPEAFITPATLSLHHIFPTKDKQHAACILEFLVWLRTSRLIAVSYEANLLRGLTKLLKFRFRKESALDQSLDGLETSLGLGSTNIVDSMTTSSSTTLSFADIPLIREMRHFQRDANRRQAVAPRVSNEELKWLSWPEYLQVVQQARADAMLLVAEYETAAAAAKAVPGRRRRRHQVHEHADFHDTEEANRHTPNRRPSRLSVLERRVAFAFQKYLILAIFANVPDRQRTIRELEIGRSFVKSTAMAASAAPQWSIKHSPDDYKTGKTYGERPPLNLPASLTPDIDDFIARWRPFLQGIKPSQSSDGGIGDTAGTAGTLFRQVKTGKPLTSDSVYSMVSKMCYYYTGKRTNPHLLRDMIVTHVREAADTTEQQLEALALFMGHSSAVQRKSYDRRTLTKKVEPAVALMEQVNRKFGAS